MAKSNQKSAPAPAATKNVGKKINRKKRNAFERKSLPKALKVLFAGSDHKTFRSVLAAWQESRKKVRVE